MVGGGNTAVEEALYLSNIASQVTLIHRRDKLRGEKILQDRLHARAAEGKVSFRWNSEVDEVLGDAGGSHRCSTAPCRGRDQRDAACHRRVHRDRPLANTSLFEGQLDMRGGYLKVKSGTEGGATATSIPGVFAAGDVADSIYRQAITSAGSGCMAALDADRYLESLEHGG